MNFCFFKSSKFKTSEKVALVIYVTSVVYLSFLYFTSPGKLSALRGLL